MGGFTTSIGGDGHKLHGRSGAASVASTHGTTSKKGLHKLKSDLSLRRTFVNNYSNTARRGFVGSMSPPPCTSTPGLVKVASATSMSDVDSKETASVSDEGSICSVALISGGADDVKTQDNLSESRTSTPRPSEVPSSPDLANTRVQDSKITPSDISAVHLAIECVDANTHAHTNTHTHTATQTDVDAAAHTMCGHGIHTDGVRVGVCSGGEGGVCRGDDDDGVCVSGGSGRRCAKGDAHTHTAVWGALVSVAAVCVVVALYVKARGRLRQRWR